MHTIRTKSGLKATINAKGAELVSLENESGKEYIWDGNAQFWGKHSPILFPIVGTLKNNLYRYENKEYSLPRHGFARDMDFEIAHHSESEITFSLLSTPETWRVYPFDFELQIHYAFQGDALEIIYRVLNLNNFEMPFSVGAHPAFALPGNFEDYELEWEKDEILHFHLLENGLVAEETLPLPLSSRKMNLNYALFEKDALVFKSTESKAITILKNEKPVVKVTFDGFPNLGIWTVQNAPFLCIEPWFGYADTTTSNGNIIEKEGIQLLSAGEIFKSAFTIEPF